MFPQLLHPQFNALVQAAAGAVFKGGEKQKELDDKEEQTKQIEFLVLSDEFIESSQKANNAEGRLA